MYSLGLPELDKYDAWMMDGQVAGFRSAFSAQQGGGRLTYATIKGAGHMAPQTNPRQSLELVMRFLEDSL